MKSCRMEGTEGGARWSRVEQGEGEKQTNEGLDCADGAIITGQKSAPVAPPLI